jgi:2-amino-4-hydroxy-6-hydroxymethyldihydropteridine diphosphokinase
VTAAPRRVFVALGSNLGDRAAHLRSAAGALAGLPGTSLLAASSLYETAPQDLEDQPAFLNQVVALETASSPSSCSPNASASSASAGGGARCALARARSMSIYCWSRACGPRTPC